MANSLPGRISPSKVFCRYFLMDQCLKEDRCEFVHQVTSASNQDSLATDQGQGQDTDSDISQDHDLSYLGLILDKGNDCTHSCCHDPNRDLVQGLTQSQGHSSNELEPTVSDDGFGMTLALHQDAATRAPNKVSSAAVTMRPEDWVKAPEFVPGQMWQFRGAMKSPVVEASVSNANENTVLPPTGELYAELSDTCPGSSMEGVTYPGQGCDLVSMALADVCELCGSVVLTTLTEDERQKHIAECIEQHEREMERSFAIQRSQEKACGICTDVIWEKSVVSEQRFGILSNCNHVFCLQCIRKWRSTKQFENKIVRACPECRVKSDFVTPSRYWVEDKEDKKKLIEEYKLALSKKPCKYFDKGRGECPFNEKCFYLHAHPDGRIASPKPAYRRRRPPTTSSSQTSESSATPSTPHAVLYEILAGWPLDRWEDLFFHLNLFELSLPSTSDEEDDDDDDDDFDDSDLSAIL